MLTDMDALIRPRTIAVVGASARRSNNGTALLSLVTVSPSASRVVHFH